MGEVAVQYKIMPDPDVEVAIDNLVSSLDNDTKNAVIALLDLEQEKDQKRGGAEAGDIKSITTDIDLYSKDRKELS